MTAVQRADLSHPTPERPRWGPAHFLAAWAIPLLAYQAWTWGAWLRAGPEQLTEFRDTSLFSWKLARSYEVAAVLTLVVVLTIVVRKCLRERRLVFDAMFCIAGAATYWLDPVCNFFQPLFLWSQQWTNVNDWVGTMPFVQNPGRSELPEAPLFCGVLYVVGFLVFVMVLQALMRATARRFPHARPFHLVLVAMVGGALIDIALEMPMYLSGLWAFPGTPDVGLFVGTGHKFPLNEAIAGGFCFGLLAALRHFRDDRGHTFLERGLERHSPRRRTLLTTLALIAAFNSIWIVNNLHYMFLGTWSGQYRDMEPTLIQQACDIPGSTDPAATDTAYGPCPGSPGYSLPLRNSYDQEDS